MENTNLLKVCIRGAREALSPLQTATYSPLFPLPLFRYSLDRRRTGFPNSSVRRFHLITTRSQQAAAAAVQEEPPQSFRQPQPPRSPGFVQPDGTTDRARSEQLRALRDQRSLSSTEEAPRRKSTNPLDVVDSPAINRDLPTYTSNPSQQVSDDLKRWVPHYSTATEARLPALRLKPSLGRVVPVNRTWGQDLQRALTMTEIRCRQNNVKTDARTQLIHVRAGQKRKNLRISRWRKAFKEGFKHEVGRIERMKRQGW